MDDCLLVEELIYLIVTNFSTPVTKTMIGFTCKKLYDKYSVDRLHKRTLAVSAAAEGSLDILKWMIKHRDRVVFDRLAEVAAHYGHLHILKWIYKTRE
jgi:hypothetical protein